MALLLVAGTYETLTVMGEAARGSTLPLPLPCCWRCCCACSSCARRVALRAAARTSIEPVPAGVGQDRWGAVTVTARQEEKEDQGSAAGGKGGAGMAAPPTDCERGPGWPAAPSWSRCASRGLRFEGAAASGCCAEKLLLRGALGLSAAR